MAGADSETQPMNAEPLTPPEPRPDRYRWTRRSLKLAGCLVVLLAGLRWWWGYEANRRLQAEIAKYRAAGQLVYAREFDAQLDAVPDAENAAVLYQEAMRQLTLTLPSGASVTDLIDNPNTMSEKAADVTALVEANQTVLSLVRQARSLPQCAWSRRLTTLYTAGSPSLGSDQRSLAKVLRLAAEHCCRMGDRAESIEIVCDLLAFSEAVERHPTDLSSLVGWGCESLALDFIENEVVELTNPDAQSGRTSPGTPATRRQIENLIEMSLDERLSQHAIKMSLLGNRACSLEEMEVRLKLIRGYMPGDTTYHPGFLRRFQGLLLEPMATLDTLDEIQVYTLAYRAAGQQTWAQADVILPRGDDPVTLLDRLSRPLSPSITRMFPNTAIMIRTWFPRYFAHLARRRLTATALAIHLFELDEGRRPLTLDELVPVYLPAVPADPFASEGTPIRYRPEDMPAVVYSIGPDGTDDSGALMRPERSWISGWRDGIRIGQGDITFRLWRRSAPTSLPGN